MGAGDYLMNTCVRCHTGQCLRWLAGGNAGLPLDTTQAFWIKMAAPMIN